MTVAPTPTLILIHGAWHSPELWQATTTYLEDHRYRSVAVDLPSACGDPSATMYDDLQTVRKLITTETESGKDVIVVCHSYGGIVGSSAIRDLHKPSGAVGFITGRVLGLIFVAAPLIPTGSSFYQGLGPSPAPHVFALDKETGYAALASDPKFLFYEDVDDKATKYYLSKLRQQSAKSFTEGAEHSYAGWLDVPSVFLAPKEDRAIPLPVLNMFVDMAKGYGADMVLEEINGSHSAMVSLPQEFGHALLQATVSLTAKGRA